MVSGGVGRDRVTDVAVDPLPDPRHTGVHSGQVLCAALRGPPRDDTSLVVAALAAILGPQRASGVAVARAAAGLAYKSSPGAIRCGVGQRWRLILATTRVTAHTRAAVRAARAAGGGGAASWSELFLCRTCADHVVSDVASVRLPHVAPLVGPDRHLHLVRAVGPVDRVCHAAHRVPCQSELREIPSTIQRAAGLPRGNSFSLPLLVRPHPATGPRWSTAE